MKATVIFNTGETISVNATGAKVVMGCPYLGGGVMLMAPLKLMQLFTCILFIVIIPIALTALVLITSLVNIGQM